MILKKSESYIQNEIISFLRIKGIFCWRNNSIGVYDASKKIFRRKSRFQINGVSDILGILPNGKFLAIEVKSAKGYPSSDQKDFINNIIRGGGVAFVARSIDDVKSALGLT